MINENVKAMQQENIAIQLEALGSPTRLSVYEQLVRAGKNGLKVGEIKKIIDIPSSTLSHHLASLVHSGLVTQERFGRNLVCKADTEKMDAMFMYLANNCCGDDSKIWC